MIRGKSTLIGREEEVHGNLASPPISNGRRSGEHLAVGITPCGPGSYRVVTAVISDGCVKQIRDSRTVGPEANPTNDSVPFANVGANTPIVLTIPRWEAIVRTVRVPTSDPEQVAQMVPFESAAHLPWPQEESQVAYEVHEADADGFTSVRLFMTRLDTIEGHLKQLTALGIKPTRVEPSVIALTRLLATTSDGERPAVLVLHDDGMEYLRLSQGGHSFSRGFSGTEDPQEFLRQSTDLDRRRYGPRQICTSLTVADGRADKGMQESLEPSCQEDVPIQTVQEAEFKRINGAAPIAPEYLTCVAAALVDGDVSQNSSLLPDREARRLKARKIFRQVRILALLLLWAISAALGTGYAAFRQQAERAERAEGEIAALQGEEGDLREQSKAVQLLRGERGRVALPLRVVLELYKCTPQQIAVNSMRYDSHGNLELSGEAPSFPEIYRYMDALLESDLLRSVEMKHGSKPQNAGTNLVEFKVSCIVNAGG